MNFANVSIALLLVLACFHKSIWQKNVFQSIWHEKAVNLKCPSPLNFVENCARHTQEAQFLMSAINSVRAFMAFIHFFRLLKSHDYDLYVTRKSRVKHTSKEITISAQRGHGSAIFV